jgi:nicotinate-nucleotide--dimethylbenzimidazole phosphoribosyltransferase
MNQLLSTTIEQIAPLDQQVMEQARARQNQLTKPLGSLGRLEELSIKIAGIIGQPRPHLQQPIVIVMAGDHGIARQGVSAYPAEVTPQDEMATFADAGVAEKA